MMDAKWRLRDRVSNAFSPSAPVAVETLFAGRTTQLRALLDAVAMRGRHAIVYGERGVGKTSLAQVLRAYVRISRVGEGSVEAPYTSCDSTDTFDSVWRKVFDDIPVLREDPDDSPVPRQGTVADELPEDGRLTPEGVRRFLEDYGGDRTLVAVIDEFDCLRDPGQRRLFAETIKLLSDRVVPATVILVGVADDVPSLLAEHASVERALSQVHMPRMTRAELREIIDKALKPVAMTVEPQAADLIASLSQGLPHYTHLLGMEAARQAVEAKSSRISREHVRPAVNDAIHSAQATIRDSYHKATMSPRKDSLYATVLLACALAQCDEQGYFAAADVRVPINRITGRGYEIPSFSRHLHELCGEPRGKVLRRIGEKHGYRFRFANPLLQPFVTLKGIAEGKVSEDQVQ